MKGRFRVTREEEDVDSGEITSVGEDCSTNGKEKKRKKNEDKGRYYRGAITAHTTGGGKTQLIESRSSRWREKEKSR